jgi:signal transduction histidine kinase
MGENDITRNVISSESIRQRIASIFPDSVILDNKFRFISISQNILEALGYTAEDLNGQPLSALAHCCNLQEDIEKRLLRGYFEQESFQIRGRNSNPVTFGISGYYLGLIADIDGMIVLKFKNMDEIKRMYSLLDERTEDLDRFVYLSSHALRGPLATMLGLINLMKMSDDLTEIKQLVDKIKGFAETLDDKLHRLILFAESDKASDSGHGPLSLQTMCAIIKEQILESSVGHHVHFNCLMQDALVQIGNGHVVLAMLTNLVNFICGLPKKNHNMLTLDAHNDPNATEIIIRANGFDANDEMAGKLRKVNFGYSEILNDPELINCYAAKKIVFKLKGSIQFILTRPEELIVMVTLPATTDL